MKNKEEFPEPASDRLRLGGRKKERPPRTPERAKARVMYLLSARDYTRAQLEEKLSRSDYPEEVIEEVLSEYSALGYLDDEGYAREYIEANWMRFGRRRLMAELGKRGISGELFERCYAEVLEEKGKEEDSLRAMEEGASERMRIRELLRKKGFPEKSADPKEKQRLYGFLARRGFSPREISAELSLLDTETSFTVE